MIDILEYLGEILDEDRVVKFDGRVYPKEGWCVILAGGPGSGKSYSANTSLPINGKITDVDAFKSLYIKMQKAGMRAKDDAAHGDDGVYDLGAAEDVSKMHGIIKKAGWKSKERDAFFAKRAGMRLENIIFDMTCKEAGDIEEVLDMTKPLGYKVALVWCACNRSEAMRRNLMRSRVVGEPIFHTIHNQVNEFIPSYLGHGDRASELDAAWILFTSSNHVGEMSAAELKDRCTELPKTGSGFNFGPITNKLEEVLGPAEPNPGNPTVYNSFKTITSEYSKSDLQKPDNLPDNFLE